MNEAYVTTKLKEALIDEGFEVWKVSDRFNASRPDLLMFREGMTVAIEVKIFPNKTTLLQDKTLSILTSKKIPSFIVTYNIKTKEFITEYIGSNSSPTILQKNETIKWIITKSKLHYLNINHQLSI